MRIREFIRRTLSERDETPSQKRVIAAWAVSLYSAVIMIAFLFTVTIDTNTLHMLDVLLGSSLGTYVVGRIAETRESVLPKNKTSDSE